MVFLLLLEMPKICFITSGQAAVKSLGEFEKRLQV
jgi:hypothetical protein